MSEQPFETVELKLVVTASDLISALEAAQYARLIQPDDPESEQEADAMIAFVQAFGACTEAWESGRESERTLALGRLGAHTEALENLRLYVHAGATRVDLTEPGQDAMPMPVAVLTITRSSLPTTTVLLPSEFATSGENVTSH